MLASDDIDLSRLPINRAGLENCPLITWPLVVTRVRRRRRDGFNLGIYRMQVTGRDTTLMRWLRHWKVQATPKEGKACPPPW